MAQAARLSIISCLACPSIMDNVYLEAAIDEARTGVREGGLPGWVRGVIIAP